MLGQFLAHFAELWIFYDRLNRKMKLRKSHYGLKFGGMVQFTMKRITIWNCHTQLFFTFSHLGRPRVLSFSEFLGFGPWEIWMKFWICNFQTSHWCLRHLLWNCSNMNVTALHWWSVNIGSGNGLLPWPEPMLKKKRKKKCLLPYGFTRPEWVVWCWIWAKYENKIKYMQIFKHTELFVYNLFPFW